MTTFSPVGLPQLGPADPSKHVNYELGMVLGVDDFVQEFAYSSARDKRIVRELIGYGVVSGLRVTIQTEAGSGPRVQVAPGELVTPSGQFVAVSPTQCANLNDWLAANRDQIGSPPPAALQLAVVGCYTECYTDKVPIPGEPCRSDEELQQPSRVQDNFCLELRLAAPAQTEDDAIRDFIAWVRRIPVVDAPPEDVGSFLEQIRQAMALEASSPPSPPTLLDFLYSSPPPSLRIPRVAAGEFLAALLAFWVSDLRALVRSPVPGAESGPSGGSGPFDRDADCLRLAELTVPLAVDAITGAPTVADTPAIKVAEDETARPMLLHLKLLQEWLLATAQSAESAPPMVAGRFRADASMVATRGDLSAHAIQPTLYLLTFPGFSDAAQYVVTGQPLSASADAQASTFEVIPDTDPGLATVLSPPLSHGIVVRVRKPGGGTVPGGFMVRIEEL